MVKRFAKHVFVVTLVLLVVVFVTGLLFGRSLGTSREVEITRLIQRNELNAESFLIEQDLFKNLDKSNCELVRIRLTDMSNELGKTGRVLVQNNSRSSLGAEEFAFLKLKYHLMQVRSYLLFERLKDKCNITSNVILYYYGINDKDSAEQGKILDQVVKDYPVSVFAIEYNYSPQLRFLEAFYNVTATPTIVLDFGRIHMGLADYDTITSELTKP
ncbi:MAG: hypothetical protein V1837_07330 [Candidatus Woesearchaeota archaeon]